MAQTDDEKPQVEAEAQDAPEVIAHGIDDDELAEFDCKIFVEL
jgi:hypothetical protein